ncbi:hypothetical protein LTS18_001633 [Coniosporium uncinatum]|uniref:Uncharacterized protein n=1 Tax=Coniosporium uncinatum TaxID=93489 RepID=A0ACC3D7V8_9PEZI|nr:hypothetical protein LTS18_001633 [Coniosporium uncinatum]
MNVLPTSCRPKHQVLVLKCYPKVKRRVDVNSGIEGGAETIKPNGSELSYLLYYANTRRSKLSKVATFLERRTESDVWRARVVQVHITLQILKALIEKTSRDLPLYGLNVLRMLKTILGSNDINLIESSVQTWEALVAAQDPAVLAADNEYFRLFEEVLKLYASCASKDAPMMNKKQTLSVPVAIRFRKAGLTAIQALAKAEALTQETGRQLAIIIPVTLQSVYAETGRYLELLQEKDRKKEEAEKEAAIRRRQSYATVRTAETGEGTAAVGTTEEADKLAEEEVGVMALQALKSIFSTNSRGLLRQATHIIIRFSCDRIRKMTSTASRGSGLQEKMPQRDQSCYPVLAEMLCGWAPVQDRFVILVTIVEALRTESAVDARFLLASKISHLLRSDINFIGLSVMDVLIALIRTALSTLHEGHEEGSPSGQETESRSAKRGQLLFQLQLCIGNLAHHIYYKDQIEDMMSAILRRLRSSPSAQDVIAQPQSAVETLGSITSFDQPGSVRNGLGKVSSNDGQFSFPAARSFALMAVDTILIVAQQTADPGSRSNKIGIEIWSGTDWLLHDPSWEVRKAYVSIFLRWLELESTKRDLRIVPEAQTPETPVERENGKLSNGGLDAINGSSLSRRAVSNASRRARSPKKIKSTVLARLHLAVYESAHEFAESDSDILLCHLLLTALISRLGVNAIRTGLSMMFRLQDELVDPQQSGNSWLPKGRKNALSLVHGYFLSIASCFEFDASRTAREIHEEIARRSAEGLFLRTIQTPPLFLDKIPPPSSPISSPLDQDMASAFTATTDAFHPFRHRQALADKIAEAYKMQMTVMSSPPASPPRTPSTSISGPILAPSRARSPSRMPSFQQQQQQQQQQRRAPELPETVKKELMEDWSKDAYTVMGVGKDSPRSASVAGSAGLLGTAARLAPGIVIAGPGGGVAAPAERARTPSQPGIGGAAAGGAHSAQDRFSSSVSRHGGTGAGGAVGIDQLRAVLQTPSLGAARPRTSGGSSVRKGRSEFRDFAAEDTGSESLVEYAGAEDGMGIVRGEGKMGLKDLKALLEGIDIGIGNGEGKGGLGAAPGVGKGVVAESRPY